MSPLTSLSLNKIVKLPWSAQSALGRIGQPYTMQNGACWFPGMSPSSDLPVGFTGLAALLFYVEAGTLPWLVAPGAQVYAMPWISRLNAQVLLFTTGFSNPQILDGGSGGMLYFDVNSASQAWYTLEQLNAPVTPNVQPVIPLDACQANGLSLVGIALNTPNSAYTILNCPWLVSASVISTLIEL